MIFLNTKTKIRIVSACVLAVVCLGTIFLTHTKPLPRFNRIGVVGHVAGEIVKMLQLSNELGIKDIIDISKNAKQKNKFEIIVDSGGAMPTDTFGCILVVNGGDINTYYCLNIIEQNGYLLQKNGCVAANYKDVVLFDKSVVACRLWMRWK